MLKHPHPLAILLLPLLLGTSASRARDTEGLDCKYLLYWDRNGVRNHTPSWLFLKRISRALSLRWQQEFDAVSGASRGLGLRLVGKQGDNQRSLDGISGASRAELRHSEKAVLGFAERGRSGAVGFYHSAEADYVSLSPSAEAAWELREGSLTLGTEAALFFDRMRPRGPYAGQGGDRRIASATLSAAQVVGPRTLAAFTLNGIRSEGFLGNPYLPVVTAGGALLAERLPDRKASLAALVQLIHGYRLGSRLGSARAETRYYADTWALTSWTADFQVYQYLGEAFFVRLRARGYRQGGATFVRRAYAGDEAYRTADIRFHAFASLLLGLKVGSAFPDAWEANPLLPDRWDLGYDHGLRDTRGELGAAAPLFRYQLYSPDQYYFQGTWMLGLSFDL